MWLYRTSGHVGTPIVLYEYQPSRRMGHPKDFLKGWSGYLHTDGYSAYHGLPENIVVVGCWAHARRKFDEALKGTPEKDRSQSGALTAKRYCDKLFAIEKQLAQLPPDERFQKRHEQTKPVLDEFWLWLNSQNLVKNNFGKAVAYAFSEWKYLERYLIDGRLEISNNCAERSIKPFVIGRENFLFANTPRGAKASSVMFSVIETAKENGLNPYEYLTFLFQALPKCSGKPIDDFLPKPLPKDV